MAKKEIIPRPNMISIESFLPNRQLGGKPWGLLAGDGEDRGLAYQVTHQALLVMGNVIGQVPGRIVTFEIKFCQLPQGTSRDKMQVELMGFKNIMANKVPRRL